MTAAEVIQALRAWHGVNGREWAFFGELRAGTGYTSYRDKKGGRYNSEQRFDAWAINLWPSRGFLRRCYEVKVSRSDFLHEIKHPEKRAAGFSVSNEFYFVTPKGLVTKDEIPAECGLLEVSDGSIATVIKAPYRQIEAAPMALFTSIARRAVEHEKRWRDAQK